MRRREPRRRPRLAGAALAAAALLAALAAAVLAAAGDLSYRGCLADSAAAGCAAAPHASLAGAAAIAVSPDGEDVYVAALEGDAVSHLRRDPSDGSLTMAGCVADGGAHDCAAPAVASLAGANGVAVDSSEGAHVIVTAAGPDGDGGAVTSLARLGNGALLYRNCLTIAAGPAGCTETSESLSGAAGVAVAARSGNVYVAATGGAVAQLDIDPGAHEDLVFESCVADGGAHGCAAPAHDALAGAQGVAVHSVSQDEDEVFVAAGEADAVSHLALDPDAGDHLAFESCIADAGAHGCAEATKAPLAGAAGVAASPDGRDVYVAAENADAVSHLRVQGDGSLVDADCIADGGAHGCTDPPQDALDGASGVAVSPDGADVYVAAQEASAIVHLRRDPNGGELTYAGCIADGGANGCAEPAHDSLGGTTALTVSPGEGPFGEPVARPGGADVYATAFEAAAISHLTREPAPPRLTATVPASPSPDAEPRVIGTAPAGSTVAIYDSGCAGAPLATGTAAELAEPGIAVSVAPGATASLRAQATVDGDVVSECSLPLSYTAAPAPPTFTATVPKSPATDTHPRLRGTAQPGSTVTLFTTPDCSGPALTSGSAAEFADPGIEVSVAAGTTASFRARATIAGAASECSRDAIAYAATEPSPPNPPTPPNPPSPPSPPPPNPTRSQPSGGGQAGGGGSPAASARLVFRVRPPQRRLRLGPARWFDLQVRNRGAAIAADVRVCIAAPRAYLRVRHCVRLGAVRPDDVKRRRFPVRLKRRAANRKGARLGLLLNLRARDLPPQRKRVHVTVGRG